VYGGHRHQAHDPRRRCAHRVERRHGDRHARPAAAGGGRRAHAEVVRQRSGRDGEMMARVSLRDVKKTDGVLQVVHGVSINIAYGLRIRSLSKADIDARVKRAAAILELGALLERRPRQLSGGQRQRVAMGRAIVREPAVFLFDEPLSNLDAKLRVQMRAELQALHRRLGTTSLYVTHDQVEAMTLARRMIVMNAGRAEQIGAPLEVYARPATTFVAGFIGSPPMNLMPARLNGREVLLGVRPEHLEPCSEPEALL